MENSKFKSKHLKLVSALRKSGFEGFESVKILRNKAYLVPSEPGVYLILRVSDSFPKFLSVGTGGYFKNKNPNVSVARLKKEWVPGATLAYVGNSSNLNRRIIQLIKFGEGEKIGHWGGRLVWQLSDAEQLLVCWKVVRGSQPEETKKKILQNFKQLYGGRRPFANLND